MKSDLPASLTKWCYAVIIVVCLAMQWYGHGCGLLRTPDSDNYISASQSLKADGSFRSPNGSWYTYWPPLFPATLSVFDSPVHAAPWMFGCVTILIGFLCVIILNRILENNLSKLIVLLLTLGSVQFMMISVFLWSEINFLLLVLCVTYCSLHLAKSRKYFFGLLVFAFLMCLQRNAGVFILTGGCCWIMLAKEFSLRIRLAKSLILFLVGISGLVVWNIYLSYVIDTGFFFYKHEFFVHALANFSTIAAMLVRIFIPVSGWVASVMAIFMLAALVFQIRRSANAVQLIGLLILFYWIGLICLFKLDVHDVDRFLSSIIFFIYVVVFEWLQRSSLTLAKIGRIAVLIAVLVWMTYPFYRTFDNLQQWNTSSCAMVRNSTDQLK